MAKQEVDIGVEGNDGTGDSIRESFRKVNENFSELYAVFGLGGDISFTNLDDTPDTLVNNEGKVVLVKPDGTGIDFYELVSNAGTNNPDDTNNTINFEISGNKLKVSSVNVKLEADPKPIASAPLKAQSAIAYDNTTANLLSSDTGIADLTTNFNATHGTPYITSDNLLVTKGYSDSSYLRTDGGVLTGQVDALGGGSGANVPQIQEVVQRSGDSMTGALELHDHPGALAGLGRPNGADDLQAASKFYVDNSATGSDINLYVSTTGSDTQTSTPAGKIGRAPKFAYRTIQAACQKAARIQQASEPDVGPYVQTITYTESGTTSNSYVYTSSFGYNVASADASTVAAELETRRQTIVDNVILDINDTYPSFQYDQTTCRRDLNLILDSIKFDILATTLTIRHNYLTKYAALRYFNDPKAEKSIISGNGGYYDQTVYSTQRLKTRLLEYLVVVLGSTSNYYYQSVDNLFDVFLNTIDTATSDPETLESSIYYEVRLYSGSNKFTDQSGDPTADRPNIDILPGKVIRGKTTGAIGQIVTYARGVDSPGAPVYDIVRLKMLKGIEFGLNEELEYGNLVNDTQISIRVESGIYEEQLPIRVPANVSIKGDEFRRSIVRPAPGTSTSPAANTWFYRDDVLDGLTITTAGEATQTGTVTGYFGRHYLTDPTRAINTDQNDPQVNLPLENSEMDVFLCNDAVIIRNITVQRHGGFMMVLDPEGSIQTRSPYAQTCTSFSRSLNRKAFHGGMFIDGYVYNMPLTITDKTDNFTIDVEAPATSGFGIRKPKTPCSFFINGNRYQVNAITDYDPNENGYAVATFILDPGSNNGLGYDNTVDSPGGAEDIVLQGAGNKSMLANDYTQINDLGYGVIATNNALSELVSVFTYYCDTGYLSSNGSQIRSLTGNNSYGNYGLVASGSDPDEVAREVVLGQDLTQPVKLFHVDQIITVAGDQSASLTVGEQLIQTVDGNAVTGTIAYFLVNGDGDTEIYVQNIKNGSFASTDTIFESDSTSLGLPVSLNTLGFTGNPQDTNIYIFDVEDYPLNASEIEILHEDGTFIQYDVVSAGDSGEEIPASLVSTYCFSDNTALRGKVFRLALNLGISDSSLTGLRQGISFGDYGILRQKQNLILNGIESDVLTRPSTALVFDEADITYRTIAFENTISDLVPTAANQVRCTIDSSFDYVDMTVDNERSAFTIGGVDYLIVSTNGAAPAGGISFGANQGDRNIAIALLGDTDADRSIGTIFAWQGKLHKISGYTIATDASGGPNNGQRFAIITFTDVYNNNPDYTGNGLTERASSAEDKTIFLRGGLETGANGNITVNISTCRATSHDFLDIGTGGYNTTNYPDRIYGAPNQEPVSSTNAVDERGENPQAQVQERTRGRVFFASTDQDGFFRVGRFFTVDQGTGTVSFNAALVLNQIDGIGFKRGVTVREFSADATFQNAVGDAVPVQTAVEGYINARLGWDRDGNSIDQADLIGGGAIRKAGDEMSGSLSMGGNQITNLAGPTAASDAATKDYVDSTLQSQDQLGELIDVTLNGEAAGDLLVYDSGSTEWFNEPLTGDVTLTYDGNDLVASIAAGAIVNANVSGTAAIAQSKLAMNAATTRANATGIAQGDLGLASFDEANFEITDGWVGIKDGGVSNAELAGSIANNKLANSYISVTDGSSTTNVALGNTVTFTGTANQIDVVESNGQLTFSIASTLNVGSSDSINITDGSTRNSNHHLLFSSGTSGTSSVYADSGLQWHPNDQTLDVNGGVITGVNQIGYTGTSGVNVIQVPSNLANSLSIIDSEVTPNTVATFDTTTSAFVFSVNGGISITGNLLPNVNSPTDSGQDIGSTAAKWQTVHATTFSGTATEALYADLAENYLGDADYAPGTVLVFGGSAEVTVTANKGDHRVAGIVTTDPAHLMNSALEGDHVVGVALQGRVPCKVLGQVRKGDMLVTSARPGYAIVNNSPGIGQVIGKAVGEKLDDGYGTVEVVVGRV